MILSSCTSADNNVQPDTIATLRPLGDEHELFILTFYPPVAAQNSRILSMRRHLEWLRNNPRLALNFGNQLLWLNQVGMEYRFDSTFFHQKLSREDFQNRIDSLLIHVDIIPEKLVMAQAVLESGWGKSYLARKANNYFGMRCFRRGCGIPPYGVKSPDFWHRKYPTIDESVRDYMLNLNTGNAYREFRDMRRQQRLDKLEPDAFELANTLTGYSELGADYIKMVKEVMNNYLPDDLAQFTESLHIEQPSSD